MRPAIYFRIVLWLALAFFCYLMVRLSLPYTVMQPDVDFLQTKEGVYHLGYWRRSFYVHVFTSSFVLIAGLSQFNSRGKTIRTRTDDRGCAHVLHYPLER